MGNGTEMVDHVRYRSPAGPVRSLADRLLLERHMIRLLKGRNEMIREIAEAN